MRIHRSEDLPPLEPGASIIDVDMALAAVTMRHGKVERPVTIEVGDRNRRCGFARESNAIPLEYPASLIKADIIGVVAVGAPIGDDDVGLSIAVQIADLDVSGGPFPIAKFASDPKVAKTVVQIDELAVGRIVADDNIEIPVAVDIGELCGIGSRRVVVEIARHRKPTATVIQKHAARQRPMAPLCQYDVGMSVSVQIADAHIGGGLRSFLKQHDALVAKQKRVRRVSPF